MSKQAWLTPDTPTEFICRRVIVPDALVPALNGAIGLLGDYWNWEEFGNLTPVETASLGLDVYCSIEDCNLNMMMVGSVQFYANTIPSGVLACDGSVYTEAEYPDLYSYLGGVGGSFNVPDMRGRFAIGADGGGYPLGTTGGAEDHTLTIAEMPPHSHASHDHIPVDVELPVTPLPLPGLPTPSITGDTGAGLAHNNMPPYIGLNAGIVALPTVSVAASGSNIEFAVIVDEKPSGTPGGNLLVNIWVQRDINTERLSATWLTLASNDFTLSQGSYIVMGTVPGKGINNHQARILRTSDNATYQGQSSRSNSTSHIMAVLVVAGSETFRVEHIVSSVNNNQDAGRHKGQGTEVYTQILVVKYA